MKRLIAAIAILLSLASFSTAYAALPDAEGPWADYIVDYSQGLTKAGWDVVPWRSDPADALGAAESLATSSTEYDNPYTEGTYFSLGFGGWIILGFNNSITNGIGDDIRIYEVTGGSYYPEETIRVDASQDGISWTVLGENLVRDSSVDLGPLAWARYVRITDTTDPSLFSGIADGYDLDGVQALDSGGLPPQDEPEGCTLTQGYWKNHEEDWPAVEGQPWWFNIDTLWKNPMKGDAWLILSHQYIAAVLNRESGTHVPSEVADAIRDARELLGNYRYYIGPRHRDRAEALGLYEILVDYNEGSAGVPHCDDRGQPAAICGNGILEEGEQCDDGNNLNGDGCSATCETEPPACVPQQELCDGVDNDCDSLVDEGFNVGESCSAGTGICARDGVYTCSPDGLGTVCNAVPGTPEEEVCDSLDNDCDSYVDEGDVCEPPEPVCGDSIHDQQEECDDGMNNGLVCVPDYGGQCSYCSETCEIIDVNGPYCGDGTLNEPYEECDDGSTENGDGCSATCAIEPECVPDEEYGEGHEFVCRPDNTYNQCENGEYVHRNICSAICSADGPCDGKAPGTELLDCSLTGEYYLQDYCDNNCQVVDDNCESRFYACTGDPACNDEEPGTGSCDMACQPAPFCGDGIKQEGVEQCDDGNQNNDDACSNNCTLTYCGDSIVQNPNGFGMHEECDDGNNLDGDGCSAVCITEIQCVPETELCDGVDNDCDSLVDEGFNTGEACYAGVGICENQGEYVCSPDGLGTVCNAVPGTPEEEVCDSLDNDCDSLIDEGDVCEPPAPVCGNGIIEEGEQCDDGNTQGGDGCSASCTTEVMECVEEAQCSSDLDCGGGTCASTINLLTDFEGFEWIGQWRPGRHNLELSGSTATIMDNNQDLTPVNAYSGSFMLAGWGGMYSDGGEEWSWGEDFDTTCRDMSDSDTETGSAMMIFDTSSWDSLEELSLYLQCSIRVPEEEWDDEPWDDEPYSPVPPLPRPEVLYDGVIDPIFIDIAIDGRPFMNVGEWTDEECLRLSGVVFEDEIGTGWHSYPTDADGNGDGWFPVNIDLSSYEPGDSFRLRLRHNMPMCDMQVYFDHITLTGNEESSACVCEPELPAPVCGNYLIEQGEQCDDGNSVSYDQCSNSCTLTYCGDGVRQWRNGMGGFEECDDGNNINEDGCSAACAIERCIASMEVCDGIDNDCDGRVDEGWACY